MANLPERLYAKTKQGNCEITLEKHLEDTEACATQIFRLDGRWGRNWCRFFQIVGEKAQQQFLLNLQIAALFHDIGKANEDFYAAVSSPSFIPQALRHEHLSALVLCLPEVRRWLSKNPILDVDVITAAVLSHHLKASRQETNINGKNHKWCQPQSVKQSVSLYFQHPEVTRILGRIANLANLGTSPVLPHEPWKAGSIWDNTRRKGTALADALEDDLANNPKRRLLLVAVKAGLIVSDAAASGLVREGKNIEDWIDEVVHAAPITPEDIANTIIYPIIGKIKARKENKSFDLDAFLAEHTPAQLQDLQDKLLQEFQKQIPQKGSRVLLLAACGAGKTLGAWKWAERQAKNFEIGKVIFLYPTRGTATEGFRDYVGWAPGAEGALVTGTAKYELEAMADNPSEAIANKTYRSEADERLYALGLWSRRYFSATVDQFLSFLEHSYQSLCLLPVLADSAVIIDEVHSFDQKMFQSLVSFLQHFKIPVLCMTATLPPTRRKQLEDIGLHVYPTVDDRHALPDLQQKEEHPRYCLEPVANFDAAFDKAVTAYRDEKRVLWVVNTVDRCLAITERLRQKFQELNLDGEVLTYHSRFRLKDRQVAHAKTIAAFAYEKGVRKPAIAVTTQVCEMSLDLDADVLISEVAPIASLIQRFGRANRHLVRGLTFLAKIYVYFPVESSPYTKEELESACKFLESLANTPISQRDLAEKLEQDTPPERISDGSARFLDSGYYAIPGSFRKTDDYTVPCVLDRDLEKVKKILKSDKKYEKEAFLINIPKQWTIARTEEHSWLPKYLRIAHWDGHYNENQGFITKPLAEVKL